MEAAGVHRAEPALHVRHDLVLGLPDEQRQHEERREHRRARSVTSRRLIAAPTPAGGTPGAWTRRRLGDFGDSWPSPGSLPPGPRLGGARASWNDLRSGVPSKPSGSSSGRMAEAAAVVEAGEVDAEHLERLALVPRGSGEDPVTESTGCAVGDPGDEQDARSAPGVPTSSRCAVTSNPGAASSSVRSTALSQSKKPKPSSRAATRAARHSPASTTRVSSATRAAYRPVPPARGATPERPEIRRLRQTGAMSLR